MTSTMTPPVTGVNTMRIRAEVLIVLGLSLGQSAAFAIWRLVERYLREQPLANQTATLNGSASDVNFMDLAYQLMRIGFAIVPAALAVYLLASSHGEALRRLGLVWRGEGARPWWRDVATGAGLAALIGLPGLAWVGIGRALGITVRINTNGLPDLWWNAAVLLLAAVAAGVLEEVVVVGYLVTRLRDLRWSVPAAIAASAILRAAYHAYQGPGMMIGNAVMGILFAWYFVKRGRVGPLIAAHLIMDAVSFIGPEVVPESWLHALRIV